MYMPHSVTAILYRKIIDDLWDEFAHAGGTQITILVKDLKRLRALIKTGSRSRYTVEHSEFGRGPMKVNGGAI